MTPCSFTASRQEGRSERERCSPGQYVCECVSIQGRVALLITVVLSLLRKPSRNGDSVSTVALPTVASAPGWPADPTSRHSQRYWDGSAWTSHVSNNGVASTDPV